MAPSSPKSAAPVPRRAAGRCAVRDDGAVTAWALAARTGDEAAVERFVRATQLDVRRYVTHLSGDAQAADDLVQDTYLRALRSLPRFEGRSSARTWLLTIARRTVADRLRSLASRPRLAGTDDWQSAAEKAQPRGVPGFDEGIALAELLSALPAPRREAFVLTQLLGLPYAEAAAIADCPVGTVRSRVARARETLVALLEEEADGTADPLSVPADARALAGSAA
ncbi:sigma-70 family RNA polymerase sigma factor [Streptomyces rimosus subsp. rimosus ATCC 10970]|uniref:RNA polymerase sigma factor n=1 Tax=Streptomyces rimosus subsp. rimosus (strain ATCC 10970 / DSM 40260 / JCM 4667 / NRRL 2234) TaxID=1265868 RepID=A0A8A1UM07_STRR1|nr:sigma-70 family RNA polymerase sigma factor [Streptomyces sp. SID5471]QDA07082.1 RNA polymerase subunit sigma [Streptomyces rimosus]QGY69258.1 sigma-70 family RNA polymerase sigma factor [Streptomyces rimosus R6-500]QST80899.1 sigma-70 family RNA polymerase sigma factor [Streptomyces rimosus subsp. rimosus ATCC 10970]QTL89196.1 sigma-70 family RNA polymerase sigma factor [Streptomyces rimosus subsp. rimosus]RSO19141.1 RNA polymerase subunit sigma [Streptomyces sp. WAC 06725]